MNRPADKCKHCKRAFTPRKMDQRYCSPKCRQAAYRRRLARSGRTKNWSDTPPAIPTTCLHCGGTFWAQRDRATFCSTSCRTLHHRALKASLPQVLMSAYGMPEEKAYDIVETQPVSKLRALLEAAGYRYAHPMRQWVRLSQDSSG